MENNKEKHICDYGCGEEATHQFKNGKWCCRDTYKKCKGIISKIAGSNTGKKREPMSKETKEKISISNKGKHFATEETKNKMRISHLGKPIHDEKWKKDHKDRMTGNKNPFFGKHHSEESKEKNRKNNIGKKKHSKEFKEKRKNIMLSGQSKKMNKIPRNKEKMKKVNEARRIYMINGGRKHACSFIKKISDGESKLREIIKKIYPQCIFQFTVLNYDVDIALLEYKIAIEYDGYYHFDTSEHIEYHKQRQIKIENEGWKFYRVSMYDKFPKLEEVKENIEKLILK